MKSNKQSQAVCKRIWVSHHKCLHCCNNYRPFQNLLILYKFCLFLCESPKVYLPTCYVTWHIKMCSSEINLGKPQLIQFSDVYYELGCRRGQQLVKEAPINTNRVGIAITVHETAKNFDHIRAVGGGGHFQSEVEVVMNTDWRSLFWLARYHYFTWSQCILVGAFCELYTKILLLLSVIDGQMWAVAQAPATAKQA